MTSPIIAGGYGPLGVLDEEAKKVFHDTVGALLGVNYAPLLVSRQVVAGMNFLFICNATVVVPDAPTQPVEVIVFRPLHGAAHIVSIKRIP